MGHLQVSASEHAGLDACYAVYPQADYLPALSSLCTWLQHGAAASMGVHAWVKQSADTNGQHSPHTEHLSG